LFDKNLMVEFSADGRFTGTRTGWLVVALGLGLGLGVGGLELVLGDAVQEAATILAQDLGSSISTSDSVSLPPAL
jgi:hypothetical protein